MIRNNKGFSLVELMVVVAIIGILSAIAIPQINKYMARARQTEAKTNLASIYTANKAFYAEYNIYDNRFNVIGYRPEGRLRYNVGWAAGGTPCASLKDYGYSGDDTGSVNAVTHCGVGGDIDATSGGVGCKVTPDGNQTLNGTDIKCDEKVFTAGAAGKVSTGTTIDEWTINQVKDLQNSKDGTQ